MAGRAYPVSIDGSGKPNQDPVTIHVGDWVVWTCGQNFGISFSDGADNPVTHPNGSGYRANSKVWDTAGKRTYDISVTVGGRPVIIDPTIDVQP